MKREELKKWLTALRSGEYQQGTESLKRQQNDEDCVYCCLGVWLELKGVKNSIEEDGDYMFRVDGEHSVTGIPMLGSGKDHKDFYGRSGRIDTDKKSCYQHNGETFESLAELNDYGVSFAEIADIIEKDPELWVRLED